MTTPTLFKEYIWLVNTIYQAKSITLNDINKKWLKTDMSGGVEMARRNTGCHRNNVFIAFSSLFHVCLYEKMSIFAHDKT